MGFMEILTIVFIVLKLTGYIDWTWVQVCMPIIISFSVYALIFIGLIAYGILKR